MSHDRLPVPLLGEVLPDGAPVRGEVLPRVEIEIRPESAISTTWRLFHVGDRRGRYLRRPGRLGGGVFGGTMRQAHQDALWVAHEWGFVYKAPPGMGLPE